MPSSLSHTQNKSLTPPCSWIFLLENCTNGCRTKAVKAAEPDSPPAWSGWERAGLEQNSSGQSRGAGWWHKQTQKPWFPWKPAGEKRIQSLNWFIYSHKHSLVRSIYDNTGIFQQRSSEEHKSELLNYTNPILCQSDHLILVFVLGNVL